MLPGSYKPRCAIEDPDAAFIDGHASPRRFAPASDGPRHSAADFSEIASSPRRGAAPNRILRGGIALGAASVVGILAIVTPGIATSVTAANIPTHSVPADSSVRPATTDTFAVRGSETDRNNAREAIETTVNAAVADRASNLESVTKQVAQAQTDVAAHARNESMSSTTTKIDAEDKRIKSQVFFWPTEGGIVSPWGMRMHPILHYARLHGGVDIGGKLGNPIYAAIDGVVTKAEMGYNGGSGNNVHVDNGKVGGVNLQTAYMHMNTIEVKVGQHVRKGQRIGTVGSTGLSTAPHLHFSVYENGVNSDPAPWLAKGR